MAAGATASLPTRTGSRSSPTPTGTGSGTSPFQTFRLRLVELLDDLLDLLERDPSYRPLPARRPDGGRRRLPGGPARGRGPAAPPGRLRPADGGALVHPDGRVPGVGRDHHPRPAAGPRAGRRASAGPWRSATSPTCSATSPRCPSSSARPASTTPWCGGACPRPIDRHRLPWAAPDGSAVRAEYLVAGYGNGAAVPDDAKALVAPAALAQSTSSPPFLARRPLLWMNGTDHQPPQPWLGRVVAEANAAAGRLRLRVTSLPDYLRGPADRRPAHVVGRAALRRPGQPADGRGLQPGRRQAGGRRGPSGRWSGWPSRSAPSACGPAPWPAAAAGRGLEAR